MMMTQFLGYGCYIAAAAGILAYLYGLQRGAAVRSLPLIGLACTAVALAQAGVLLLHILPPHNLTGIYVAVFLFIGVTAQIAAILRSRRPSGSLLGGE